MKKIAYITGTRADFGRMMYTLKEIQNSEELELQLIVTGMHLSSQYGSTIKEIEKDFKVNSKVEMLLASDSGSSMAQSLGFGIINITQSLKELEPDLLLLLGDRGEMLAGAIAASHMNIPTVHIAGGDISGTIDESIRHAISKFAHYHLTSTKEHANRLIAMGESPERIEVVGATDLDAILNMKLLSKKEVEQTLGITLEPSFLVLTYHPVVSEITSLELQMRNVIKAVHEIDLQTIVISPNSDAGSNIIQNVINEQGKTKVHVFKNIPYQCFLSTLNLANVMIGNSSSAIIEAPSFGLPSVNIGSRQQGRTRGNNVIDVEPDKNMIVEAVRYALNNKRFLEIANKKNNPYGQGDAYKKIVHFLENIKIEDVNLNKSFYDLTNCHLNKNLI
ncbi:UDP-N-acetylglucosamine 2-epimerase [Pontibacillus litoralis]|uniref:UDP-N-acetylglucosamine 2-epimerase domain-containing protein n=1 Tax=Pontibacillus litoralis JSM 072002 TaxID=1385512 RepID=A0A0A5HRV2_9BACI|nr:UDP-N-acetylglucosamine 2-epimerase [Pontibacillus litoralis]KGX86362.1 hypothetical protein N784_05270 [Pontibacillus litoralis JSM 072002]